MAERTSNNKVAGVDEGPNRAGAAPSLEDAALLNRCREGDSAAFAPLVRKYQDRLFNVLLRYCGNRDDAEELCQEAFVKALEKIRAFRQASGFYTWLFRIGTNLAISRRRRSAKVKFHSLGAADEDGRGAAVPAECREDAPGDSLERAETNRRVAEALGKLDEEFRIVAVLRDVEDMKYEGIAEILSIPIGTVKSRLYRARCMLKEELRDLIA